jgi:hypothetical protein
MSWANTNSSPRFTSAPTSVNTADLQTQLAILNQQHQSQRIQGQPQAPQQMQQLPFLTQGVPLPDHQQQSNDHNPVQHTPSFTSQEELFHHLRRQHHHQPPQAQKPPQAQPQAQPQQQPGQNPTLLPQNQWLQQQQGQQQNPQNALRNNIAEIMLPRVRIPPLDRVKFDNALKIFYQKANRATSVVDQPLRIENHNFTLWDLHRELFFMGTFMTVSLMLTYLKIGIDQKNIGQHPKPLVSHWCQAWLSDCGTSWTSWAATI